MCAAGRVCHRRTGVRAVCAKVRAAESTTASSGPSNAAHRALCTVARGWQPASMVNTKDQESRQTQKMEAVARLACGIAHDFNNVLTSITGYSELVIAKLATTDPIVQDVHEIRRAALSAARLTKQLLAFGAPQCMQTDVLDLNAVVARIVGLLQPMLGENVTVTLARR